MIRPHQSEIKKVMNLHKDQMEFLPLLSVEVDVEITDSIALVRMKQVY